MTKHSHQRHESTINLKLNLSSSSPSPITHLLQTTTTMTSRRPNASEKTAPAAPESSQPAVPKSVVAKLLGFTFAMVTVPIGAYFLTVDTVFKGTYLPLLPPLPAC